MISATATASAQGARIFAASTSAAPVEMAAPTPEPEPAPPTPQPAPKPQKAPPAPSPKPVAQAPKPIAPAPTPKPTPPAKPAKPAAKPDLDLDALAASLKSTRASGQRQSSAARGPSRPETAAQTQAAAGARSGQAAAALSALASELGRRWNPNCNVEGGADVKLTAAFTLSSGGRLQGPPQIVRGNSSDPVVQAAATRALSAIRAAEPFESLPPEFYGQRISVNFIAKDVCNA